MDYDIIRKVFARIPKTYSKDTVMYHIHLDRVGIYLNYQKQICLSSNQQKHTQEPKKKTNDFNEDSLPVFES